MAKKIRRINKQKSAEVDQDLYKIYEDDDGKLPDLTTVSRESGRKATRILTRTIQAFCVLAVISVLGFFFFSPYSKRSGAHLSVTINGNDNIQNGVLETYQIAYANDGSIPIASLEIKLNMPEQFVLKQARPEQTSEGNTWTIGHLSPGSDGLIELNGYWTAQVPSSSTIQTIFTYKPANFNSDFQDISTKTVSISKSALEIKADGPEETIHSEPVTYEFTVKNVSEILFEKTELKAVLPNGFIIEKSEPELPEGSAQTAWIIENLKAGDETKISITGSYSASVTGVQTIDAEAGIILSDQSRQTQTSAQTQTDVLGGDLSAFLIANGSNENKTLSPGDTLRVSFDIKNNSDANAEHISARIFVSPNPTGTKTLPLKLDQKIVSDSGIFTAPSNKQAYASFAWGEKEVNELLLLPAHGEKSLFFSVPILQELTSSNADTMEIKAELSVSTIGKVKKTKTLEITPIIISINSNASVNASAYYFNKDGTEAGKGPLPPKAGVSTTYRVSWTVTNSLHELENLSLQAELPPGVSWAGTSSAQAGELSFDQQARIVSWKLNRMPTSVTQVTSEFEIAITPTEEDIGTFVKLTGPAGFEATDVKTKDTIRKSFDILTTELIGDSFAAGKGVVIE
ncbi:MAG: hypothetical protein ACD_76C00077G0002 [uncultured bacterium]|nr:MAG: hypothetical protein ACD_76C00077G0002 [uncultured bacterium]